MRVASDVSPFSPRLTSSMIRSRCFVLVVGFGVGGWFCLAVCFFCFCCVGFAGSSESWLFTSSNNDALDDRQRFYARSATHKKKYILIVVLLRLDVDNCTIYCRPSLV